MEENQTQNDHLMRDDDDFFGLHPVSAPLVVTQDQRDSIACKRKKAIAADGADIYTRSAGGTEAPDGLQAGWPAAG